MEVSASQVNFAAGQLSKKFLGRVDLPNFYKAGMQLCRNFIPQVQGPAEFRTGSQYILHTRNNSKTSLYPFVFNDEQAYALAFSDKKLRFFSDGGAVMESSGSTQYQFLCQFNGVDGATNYTAESGQNLTFAADAQLDTAQKKFGLSSALFDSTGGKITVPDSEDWDFGTGDFTIDFWVRFAVIGAFGYGLMSTGSLYTNGVALTYSNGGSTSELAVYLMGTRKAFSWTSEVDTWYHVALTRNGTDLRAFIDGTQIGSTETNSTNIISTGGMNIGGYMGSTLVPLNGWLDEIRVIKGTAAWVADFTPPTSEYSSSGIISISAITEADPGVITAEAHGYSDGDEIFISDVEGMTELNNKYYLVVYIDADSFSLTDIDGNAIDTSGYTTYTAGGKCDGVYEIDTPYVEADLDSLQFAQKADLMYIVHPNYEPRKLTRSGDADWTLATYTRTDDPFTKTIAGITQADPGVVTATAHGFEDGDIVELWGVSGMTDVNGNQYKVANKAANTFELTDPVTGADIDTSGYGAYVSGGVTFKAGNMPGAVAFYGGRLFFGGTDDDPEVFWGSKAPDNDGTTNYDVYTVGASAEDAIIFPLSSQNNTADRIQWFAGTSRFLAIGTYGGIYKANGGSDNDPISGTAINVKAVEFLGCKHLSPVRVGSVLFYVQRGGLILNSFAFSLLADDYKAASLNIFSDEITKTGLKQLTVQQGDADIVWAVTEEGKLIGMTVKVGEEINAWHSHEIGGDDAVVLSVCGEPQPDNKDSLWLVVERTIDGRTRRYMEYIEADTVLPEPEDYYTGTEATDDGTYRALLYETAKDLIRLDSSLSFDGAQAVALTPASAAVATGVTFTASAPVFAATDVGRYIVRKYVDGTESGKALITAYTSSTVVTATIQTAFDSTDEIPENEWYLTVTELTGLDHLEGETVHAQIDGYDDDTDYTVTDGAITLGSAATKVHVGLPYVGRLMTMPLDIGAMAGTAQARIMTVNRLGLLFRHSRSTKYGTDLYRLEQLKSRDLGAVTGRPSMLVTETAFLNVPDGYDRRKTIYIVQDTANPCTIQGIVPFVDTTNE